MKQIVLTTLLAIGLTVFSPLAFSAEGVRGIRIEPKTGLNHPLAEGTYRALVIGNNDYQDPENLWEPLKTAVSDSHAIGQLLATHYGFTDVTVVENATRRDILVSIRNLADRVQPNDSVLLYYAGHGFLDEENSRGYWVPVDAVGTDHTTFVRNSTIRDELSIIASRVRHTLLLSDSCFSGTLLRDGNRGAANADTGSAYYEKLAQKRSAQIIAAGGVEYVDDDYRNSGHSPFTYFLLNELTVNNQPVLTATELGSQVSRAVANNVDQVPESGVLYGAGDELGEFLFLKVDVDVTITKEALKPVTTPAAPKTETRQPVPPKKPGRISDSMVPMPTL